MTLVPPLAEGSSSEEPAPSVPETTTPPESYAGPVPPPREGTRPEAEQGPTGSGVPTSEPAGPTTESIGPDGPDGKRRYPSTIGGACYLVILAITIVGLAVVGAGHWRGGLHAIAAALVAGAVVRFVLPQRDAGMLAVRARWIDCTMLGVLGILLWVLASTTPNA